MKIPPSKYFLVKELDEVRLPCELYKITRGSTSWYYTSGDVAVANPSDPNHPYEPATIQRGTIQFNSNLESNALEITFAKTNPALIGYLAVAPVNLATIEIRKLFRDQDPPETVLIFKGQIRSVNIAGLTVKATCVGLDYFLKQTIPKQHYQPECNWSVFGQQCGKSDFFFRIHPTVTVSGDGKTLSSKLFDDHNDGWWTLGLVKYSYSNSLIVNHIGQDITLQTAIPGLETGMKVYVWPGCDGKITTCRDKYNWVDHFGGHPYIPLDNPCLWIP